MNHHRPNLFAAARRWLLLGLAMLALPIAAPAQPAGPQRWLFVFDLSATMKKRLPATEDVLKNLLATGAGGRLQPGDYIGIWTYDSKLHAGQFPLVTWNPDQVTAIRTNLMAFLRTRSFSRSSQLAALQPPLDSVIAGSERLTVIIFCDGNSDISATPYDRGINQNFRDGQPERKKSGQPFVVVLRTAAGKYTGCTVNFPPGTINLPPFPAPPPPTNPPPPAPRITVPVKPPVVVPDLIITGTNQGPAAAPTPKSAPVAVAPASTSPPAAGPIIVPAPGTNPAPATTPAATNPVPPAAPATPAMTSPAPQPAAVASHAPTPFTNNPVPSQPATVTNPPAIISATTPPPAKVETAPAATAANPPIANTQNDAAGQTRQLIYIGAGLLAAAAALIGVLLLRRQRRPQGSLISRSMADDPPRK